MKTASKQIKEIIEIKTTGIKFSIKEIKKGSMKNTFMLGTVKNRTTGVYDPLNDSEMMTILNALNDSGYVYYSGTSLLEKEPWYYFNGGGSISFKKAA